MNSFRQSSSIRQSSLQSHGSPSVSEQLQLFLHQLKQQVWEWIMTYNDPKITQQFDRQGHCVGWRVFDPETGQTIGFGSELEVRLWLEHRYR